MSDTNLDHLIVLIKKELRLLLSISFGIFLFVLFFEPFTLDRFDFNNRLIFVAGLAGIIFLLMAVVRVILRWFIPEYGQPNHEPLSYMGGFAILALSSVAIAFYLRYVGETEISFYIMFKVLLICLAPPVVLRLSDLFQELKQQNESLLSQKETIQNRVRQYEDDYLNKSIEFTSDNHSENLVLPVAEVVLMKSADNYVEVVYREGDSFKKKLLRTTLRNIEQQTKPYSNFTRCHRTSIVNTFYVERLHRKFNNHWLTIKGYPKEIPVSRQYLLKLREIL
jgi:DNA-binding LytR/AlgR family response regulator